MEAPPLPVLVNDPDGADAARLRLRRKSNIRRLFSRSKSRQRINVQEQPVQATASPVFDTPIVLDATTLCDDVEDFERDKYEWAVVYENQRG